MNRFRLLTLSMALLIGPALNLHGPLAADDSHSALETPSATETIRQRGKLVMLCFPTLGGGVSPNLEHGATRRSGTSEHFVGLEVTLMEKLAARLGVELEIRTLEEPGYAPLLPALLEGRADLVASTLSITPERRKIVDFSIPYQVVYQVVLARQGSGIRSTDDLADKVAVAARGTSHHQHLKRMGISDQNLRLVEFVEEYFTELAEKRADFAIIDSLIPDELDEFQNAQTENRLEVALTLPEVDSIAIALPPGSDLKQPLDALIRELTESGELEVLLKKAMVQRAEQT